MRLPVFLAALALAVPAAAQTPAAPPAAGEYGDALRQMITEGAAGTCNAELMAGELLAACNAQISQMASGLSSLGAVQSVTFVRAEETPQGRLEIYTVQFAGGQSMNWFIGQRQADGKFNAAGTGG